MRILYDGRLILNQPSGLSRYSLRLIQSLLEIDRRNEYVILFDAKLNRHHPLHRLKRFENAHFIPSEFPALGPLHQLSFPLIQQDIKADLYHYPHFDFPFLAKFPALVVTIHDLQYVKYPKFYVGASRLKYLYTYAITWIALKKVSQVVTVSRNTLQDIMTLFPGTPRNKLQVIYQGVDPIFFARKDPNRVKQVLSSYGIESRYFLFVGAIRPHKNVTFLIESFSKLVSKIPDHDLVICGNPYPGYTEPIDLVSKLKLRDKVKFIGHVPDQDLVYFYQGATCLIYPSLYEGFGLPVLEAMACGIPVIASRAASIPEAVGEAGILIDPRNIEELIEAMISITIDYELRTSLVEKGLSRSRLFSWKRTAQQVLDLYEKLVEATQ